MKLKTHVLDRVMRSGTITDKTMFPCSVCGTEAVYVRSLDRQVHTDGSDNWDCWMAITSGAVKVGYVYMPSRPQDY
jgi:hypothetical protein